MMDLIAIYGYPNNTELNVLTKPLILLLLLLYYYYYYIIIIINY